VSFTWRALLPDASESSFRRFPGAGSHFADVLHRPCRLDDLGPVAGSLVVDGRATDRDRPRYFPPVTGAERQFVCFASTCRQQQVPLEQISGKDAQFSSGASTL